MSIKDLFFDFWYRIGEPDWVINEPQPDLIKIVDQNILVGKTIIDIGCGTGDNSLYLSSRGYSVTGIDVSSKAISIAKRKARERNQDVSFQQLNAFQLNKLNQKFDTVIDYGLLHQFQGTILKNYILSIESVCKDTSRLLLQCFSDQNKKKENFGPRLMMLLKNYLYGKFSRPKFNIQVVKIVINRINQQHH